MLYDFGLGGVGQINPQTIPTAGLTPYSSPPPPQLPAPTAVPPKIPSAVNPYEAEQIRLLNEQRKLLDQYSKLSQPEIKYQSPMNPLAAALISFGAGTLAHGGNSSEAIGSGVNSGLNTYLGLKQANQEGENKTSQANYANQVNRLKAIMGGLEEMSAGYGGLSKDQAERAKAAALVSADVYGNQVKQDYYNAQNAMEAGKLPFLTNLYSAQANNLNFSADPNNPYNKQAVAAAKLAGVEERNAIARQKMEGEFTQRVDTAIANAKNMSDEQLQLEANRLFQASPILKDPLADKTEEFKRILNTLIQARAIARGETSTAPGLTSEPGKPKTKPNTNPVSQYLTLP